MNLPRWSLPLGLGLGTAAALLFARSASAAPGSFR
jgi:hypothetical protein